MVIIFVLLFNALEAVSDGLYDEGHKLLAGIIEFVWKALIVLSLVYLLDSNIPTGKDPVSIIISFALVRYFMFDALYNLTRGLPIFFVGSTKLYDKILSKIGLVPMVITKCIAGFVGVIFLL